MQAEPVPTRDPADQPTLVDLDLADDIHLLGEVITAAGPHPGPLTGAELDAALGILRPAPVGAPEPEAYPAAPRLFCFQDGGRAAEAAAPHPAGRRRPRRHPVRAAVAGRRHAYLGEEITEPARWMLGRATASKPLPSWPSRGAGLSSEPNY